MINNKQNMNALFKIGYGLYVITTNDGNQDNGCIVNSVLQVTSVPNRIAVAVNKLNYTHQTIMETMTMNINVLSIDTPFKVFQVFGFQSGRDVNKFAGCTPNRTDNGLIYLPKYINAVISLKVQSVTSLDTHSLFICDVTEAQVLSDRETMTYTYYQNNVKPKPVPQTPKGYVCKICGFIYQGDELPVDYVCPICNHPAVDFEKLE